MNQRLDQAIKTATPLAVDVRRRLHQYPELGWKEHKTQQFLTETLEEKGLKPRAAAKTGLIVDVGSGTPSVLYRADIDALPIGEQPHNSISFGSEHEGIMHACGHDMHSAIGVGLALTFNALSDTLPGAVRFMFQPAEEIIPSGAEQMVNEGVLDGIQYALALHVDPHRTTGNVGVREGLLTATSDTYRIRILGKAGHSARPHLAKDAILLAADVIRALYSLVGQRIDPLDAAVINVGIINGGSAENIIAGSVDLTGVVRTMRPETRQKMHDGIQNTVGSLAKAYGCEAEIKIELGSGPIRNDSTLHQILQQAAQHVVGDEGVHPIEKPSTGAEDFGRISEVVPSYMMRLGVKCEDLPFAGLHTPNFFADENAIPVAMGIMSRAIWQALSIAATDGQ